MVTSTASLIKQKFKGEGNPTSTGLNVPGGARSPIDLNLSNEADQHLGSIALTIKFIFPRG